MRRSLAALAVVLALGGAAVLWWPSEPQVVAVEAPSAPQSLASAEAVAIEAPFVAPAQVDVQLPPVLDAAPLETPPPLKPAELLRDGGNARAAVRIHGVVVDERGAPLPEATIVLSDWEGKDEVHLLDEEAHFDFTTYPGWIFLDAKADGYVTRRAQDHKEEGEQWELRFTLGKGSIVSGVVATPDGLPIANAWVRVKQRDYGSRHPVAEPQVDTRDDGTFSIATQPGVVELQVSATGHLSLRATATSPASGLRLVMQKGGRVEGRVLNEDGSPAVEVEVKFNPSEGYVPRAETDANGLFGKEGIADGPLVISVTHEGRSAQASVVVREGAAPFVELRLAGIQSARGRVVDELGQPVAGITVRAIPAAEVRSVRRPTLSEPFGPMGPDPLEGVLRHTSAISGVDGTFVFPGLAAGEHLLAARRPPLADDRAAPLFVHAGSEDVVLRLRRPHFLTAEVTTFDGVPVSRVWVNGTKNESPGGHLAVEIEYSGEGDLVLTAEGCAPLTRELKLSRDGDTPLGTVRLPRGRTVTATVTQAGTGQALRAGFRVDHHFLPTTEIADAVRVTVPEGAVTLHVFSAGFATQKVKLAPDQQSIAIALTPRALTP